ncbi:hypothetical protein ACFYWY_22460 [Streptomyces sp. NPDC002870]|uniref:hypothetical protein n=1 Tax=Streptomyces sp. NPDC002870 TaxID=3364666 RepID=UPI003682DE3A
MSAFRVRRQTPVGIGDGGLSRDADGIREEPGAVEPFGVPPAMEFWKTRSESSMTPDISSSLAAVLTAVSKSAPRRDFDTGRQFEKDFVREAVDGLFRLIRVQDLVVLDELALFQRGIAQWE